MRAPPLPTSKLDCDVAAPHDRDGTASRNVVQHQRLVRRNGQLLNAGRERAAVLLTMHFYSSKNELLVGLPTPLHLP